MSANDKFVKQDSLSVEALIPRSLVNSSQNLIELLSSYYEWMEQEGMALSDMANAARYRDVDSTLDEFINQLHLELGSGFNKSTLQYKDDIYKNLKEIYLSKGSIDSVKLLFRLLFNYEDVIIRLPKEEILIASDGRWKQELSIFVEVEAGVNINSLVQSRVDIYDVLNDTWSNSIEVFRFKRHPYYENVFELFISNNYVKPFKQNSQLYLNSTLVATVVGSTNEYNILNGGTDFYPGFTFSVDTETGAGVVGKVLGVDATGAITRLSFVTFGSGYNTTELITISPSEATNVNVLFDITSVGDDTTLSYDDKLGGFAEVFAITEDEYTNGTYHEGSYSGTPLYSASFDQTYDVSSTSSDIASLASIELLQGDSALNGYEGYYTDNKGFLSDAMRLQDNFYYQNFSYVVRSNRQNKEYTTQLNKSIHPAGMIVFSDYVRETTISNPEPAIQVVDSSGNVVRSSSAGLDEPEIS